MGNHLFLCYSHGADRGYVESLAEHLAGAGLSVWFDREIITGDRWEQMIRIQIDTCAGLIVVMSPEAEASDWVAREVHRAETRAKPIYPILLRGEVFFRLSNLQFEDATGGRMPTAAFVGRLRELTRIPSSPTATRPADPRIIEAVAAVGKAVENLTPRAAGGSPSLIVDFALGEITRLSEYLKLLGQVEDLVYEGEDRDWLLGLTSAVRTSIDATSLVTADSGVQDRVDGGLWTSDLGLLYLKRQREAMERGVRIRRIFLLESAELRSPEHLARVQRMHTDLGIEVRTLYPETAGGVHKASLSDFIIFDAVLSYHVTLNSARARDGYSSIVTSTLVTDSTRVTDRIAQYERLWEAAS